LSVVLGFDGVTDVMVITDPVVHEGTPRRKVVHLLLPRLGALAHGRSKLLPEVLLLLPTTCEV
jgi:hypothetical protein